MENKKISSNSTIILAASVAILLLYGIIMTVLCVKYYNKSHLHYNNYVNQWTINQRLTTDNSTLREQLDKYTPTVRDSYLFTSGNYVAGVDFVAGYYDITAVTGYGNVSSDNMFDGGINTVMAPKSEDDFGLAEQSYKNVYLPEGVTLSIDGVKIRLKTAK